MTVINLKPDIVGDEIKAITEELKSGERRNAIIISEMQDEDDFEGDLSVVFLGIGPGRAALGMLTEAQQVILDEMQPETEYTPKTPIAR